MTIRQTLQNALCATAFMLVSAVSSAYVVTSCSLNDLTTSTSCAGVFDPGNDHGVNTIFDNPELTSVFGTGWSLLSKTEADGWAAGNFNLTVTGQGSTSGTWNIDLNWAALGYAQGDVLAVLKAGNRAAAYELNVNFSSGDWDVSGDWWKSSKNNRLSALSHFSFWVKESTPVSEPATLALFGLGLISLGAARRRQKQA